MPDLDFRITGADVAERAIQPSLAFRLRITNATPGIPVEAVSLHCQIRIAPARRHYAQAESELLRGLFGDDEHRSEALKSFLWTDTSLAVPGFGDAAATALTIPCTYDFNMAATKFFHALDDGDAPLDFLFSGSVFYRDPDDHLQIEPIPWTKTVQYRLRAALWRDMMHRYYADTVFLPIERDTMDRLYRFRTENGFADWGHAIEALMQTRGGNALS